MSLKLFLGAQMSIEIIEFRLLGVANEEVQNWVYHRCV